MTLEQQIANLELRINDIETNLDTKLDNINLELHRIGRGIYGDKDNKTTGLIERQELDEKRLKDLEKRVIDIEEKLKVDVIKKDTVGIITSKAIKIFGVIMMAYLVLKNVVGVDTLIEIFLKK